MATLPSRAGSRTHDEHETSWWGSQWSWSRGYTEQCCNYWFQSTQNRNYSPVDMHIEGCSHPQPWNKKPSLRSCWAAFPALKYVRNIKEVFRPSFGTVPKCELFLSLCGNLHCSHVLPFQWEGREGTWTGNTAPCLSLLLFSLTNDVYFKKVGSRKTQFP